MTLLPSPQPTSFSFLTLPFFRGGGGGGGGEKLSNTHTIILTHKHIDSTWTLKHTHTHLKSRNTIAIEQNYFESS